MISKGFPYKMVVFDVDGTLLDTSEGLLSAIKFALKKHNLKELKDAELKKFIGPPIQESLKKYYNLLPDQITEITATFREQYKSRDLFKAIPYDSVFEVLDWLQEQEVIIAIATYKREDYAVSLMEHFGFNRYTHIIYGADDSNKLTKYDIIKKCLDRAENLPPEEILVVGDSNSDGVGAKINGCDFCGVTYGFGTKTSQDFTVETAYVINNIREMLSLV